MGWIVSGAALWLGTAVVVARVLGTVIARADRDDPAVGAPPLVLPAQRRHGPVSLPGTRAVG